MSVSALQSGWNPALTAGKVTAQSITADSVNVSDLKVNGVSVTGLTSSGRTQNQLYSTPTPVPLVGDGSVVITTSKLRSTVDSQTGATTLIDTVYPDLDGGWTYLYSTPFVELPIVTTSAIYGDVGVLITNQTTTQCSGFMRFRNASDNPSFVINVSGTSITGLRTAEIGPKVGDEEGASTYPNNISAGQSYFLLPAWGNGEANAGTAIPSDYVANSQCVLHCEASISDTSPGGINFSWDGKCVNGTSPVMTVSWWLCATADQAESVADSGVKVAEWRDWPTNTVDDGAGTKAWNQDLYLPAVLEPGAVYYMRVQINWDVATYGTSLTAITGEKPIALDEAFLECYYLSTNGPPPPAPSALPPPAPAMLVFGRQVLRQ